MSRASTPFYFSTAYFFISARLALKQRNTQQVKKEHQPLRPSDGDGVPADQNVNAAACGYDKTG